MKKTNVLAIIMVLFLADTAVFADAVEPIIKENVTVRQNATPDQCPSSYDSDSGVDQETREDGAGMQTLDTAPGVTSCSDCSIVNGDCVCKTCYTNFDS